MKCPDAIEASNAGAAFVRVLEAVVEAVVDDRVAVNLVNSTAAGEQ